LPGVASELELGLPPGNDQEYAVTVPSGSEPEPEKYTDWPAVMVTSVAGLVIVPVGGLSAGAGVSWTNRATEGTPEEFRMKSM
jgi:hypothetical protein